jgi:hypothetical protein
MELHHLPMNDAQIRLAVREAAPHCGANDSMPEGRYRIWMDHPCMIVKGQTKKELAKNLRAELDNRRRSAILST